MMLFKVEIKDDAVSKYVSKISKYAERSKVIQRTKIGKKHQGNKYAQKIYFSVCVHVRESECVCENTRTLYISALYKYVR